MNFVAINEKNEFKDGKIIAIFKTDNSHKEYAIFSLSDYNNSANKIAVSYLIKDKEGYDDLEPIYDDDERDRIVLLFNEWRELNGKEI